MRCINYDVAEGLGVKCTACHWYLRIFSGDALLAGCRPPGVAPQGVAPEVSNQVSEVTCATPTTPLAPGSQWNVLTALN